MDSTSETVTGELTLRGQVTVELDPSSGDAILTLTHTNETNWIQKKQQAVCEIG